MQKRRILLFVLGLLLTFIVAACTPTSTDTFTVSFNSHGGPSVASVTVDADGLVTQPSITRDGFTLDGWYKEAAYTTEWIFATDRVTANITLHAKWTAVGQTTFTITFDTDGGSTVASQTRTNGQTFGTLPTPTKSGFTFDGWYLDQARTQAVVSTTVVSGNVTLYAKWVAVTETFTVTFDPGLGEVIPGSRQVPAGSTVLPPNADYMNHELIGWFKESTFVNEWDFDVDTVTSDITLYAKWELIPEGVAITTPDEFYNLVNGTVVYESGAQFYLRNNLDFTGFEWDGTLFAEALITPHTFNLNGNGKTISNISFTATNQAGIIQRMAGGSVYDLTLDNIHLEGASQGGVLVGRIVNGSTVTISDVTVMNSSVKGGSAGVAGLIGHIQGATAKSTVLVERVAILNVEVNSNSNGAGGLVGDIESSKLTVNDVIVDAHVTTTGERVGGIVGEARRNSNSQELPEVVIDNAVVYVNLTGLRYLGAVVGRADSNMTNLDPTIHGEAAKILPGSISDVILIGNYMAAHENPVFGHLGRSNLPEATNAYAVAFNYNRASLTGLNVAESNVFASVDLLPLSAFAGFSDFWAIEAGSLPAFENGLAIDLGYKVTIELGETSQVQYVREGGELTDLFFAPESGEFIGWTSDAEGLVPLTIITEATSAYPKFMDVFVVTFDSNEGSAVLSQDVYGGELAVEPVEPTRFGYEFTGWFIDEALETLFDFATPITEDITLYAGWDALPLEEFTVSFETNGGNTIEPVIVLDGGMIMLPPLPTKEGFIFDGWFTDTDLEVAFVPSTPVTADMTLYAKWVEDDGGEAPVGIAIQSAQAFYDMATGSNDASLSETYYLATDIDFTGFTWVGVAATFTGELNGNGKTLSNLTYNVDSTSVFNGLFHIVDGAKIHNFTIENFTFTSSVATTRSAFIAGQVHGANASYIEHITIKNSSISANEYVAAIVGRATGSSGSQVHISNIVLDDVTIKGYYVAGIIGDLDATSGGSTISDIWANINLSGAQNTRTTAERLGGVVSRARSGQASMISRIYMNITAVSDKWAAGIAGDVSANALQISDVFVTGSIATSANSGRAIAGNNGANAVVSNVYEYAFTGNGTGGLGGTVVESTPDQTWWNTNLSAITQSPLWMFNETSNMYELKRLNSGEVIPPTVLFTVSFDTDGFVVIPDQNIVENGFAVAPAPVVKLGYAFLGWFEIDAVETFDFATPITADLVLEARFEALPPVEFTVSFNTNAGNEIADQVVIEGELLVVPAEPTKAGYGFIGWFMDASLTVPFNPAMPITADMTLYAGWEVVNMLAHYTFGSAAVTGYGVGPLTFEDITIQKDRVQINTSSFVPHNGNFMLIMAPISTATTAFATFDFTDEAYAGLNKLEFMVAAWSYGGGTPSFNAILALENPHLLVEVEVDSEWVTLATIDLKTTLLFEAYAKVSVESTYGAAVYRISYVALDAASGNTTQALVIDDLKLFAPVVIEGTFFTVAFDTNEGSPISDVEVLEGEALVVPTAPTKEGFDFDGWFTDAELTIAFDPSTLIMADMTLYAKWVEAVADPFEGYTAITTAQEFIAAVSSINADVQFYLANDIDFTGVEWIQSGSGANFAGYLDGNQKTISNITITSSGTGVRGGIFQRANGATIKNLIIDNANVDINGRAGVLIGGSDSSGVGATVNHVTILNSSVKGTVNEGTGIVIGQAAGGVFNLSNIVIHNASAYTTAKNVSLLVGRSDAVVNIENILVTESRAESTNANTDAGVGGLVGYLNHASSVVNATDIILMDIELAGRGAGFLIGYNNISSAISISNMYVEVTFIYEGSNGQQGAIGRRNTGGAAQVLTDVYALMTDAQTSGAEQLGEGFLLLAPFSSTDFSNNLPMIYTNEFFAIMFIE